MAEPHRESRAAAGVVGSLIVIAAVVGGTAAAFAYTAGWLSPHRLTPARIVDALSERGGDPVGHRRNHAKGICFTGMFEANGAGARLSTAPMLAAGRYPVLGRFSIAVGDPRAADASARVRAMAIRVSAPDGQEWRSAMIDAPVFPVATPQAFYEQALAARVDPTTGRPDPAAMQRFVAAHPETAAFNAWAHDAPWTTSYAADAYNGLNAFVLVDASGARRAVRWSMQPTVPPQAATPADLARLGPDFLERDLEARLRAAPLSWRMVMTLAAPGDRTDDATVTWPAGREQVDVGTLVVEAVEDDADGPCRDINYDPLVLPTGIAASDDPLLSARSSVYANSFDRRTLEIGLEAASPAAGESR